MSASAGGNGEQAMSRDVYRLGSRLDWFRLMSWYHSGIGFFVNSALTMASVYLAIWLTFLFALSNALAVRNGEDGLISAINTVQIIQLGLLSIIPYWGELALESGVVNVCPLRRACPPGVRRRRQHTARRCGPRVQASVDIFGQIISGSILFFIFRQQTSAHYFTQIAYYGGAKYIGTGRGFDLTHTPFVKIFSLYGRSHIYFGYQLALLAIMLALLDVPNYFLSTWGTWLVAISLTFSPLWFNPQTFLTDVAWEDFKQWRDWMTGSIDRAAKASWCAAQ